MRRILRKGVQDIGPEQFLVLLLVVQAELDQRNDGRELGLVGALQQPFDGLIDMGAIGRNLRAVRPRDHAALRPRVARTGGDVIGVEQKREALVELTIVGSVRFEQKLFEEPGGVGAMPFGRAGVSHRLHLLILVRQRRGAALGLAANDAERLGAGAPIVGRRPGGQPLKQRRGSLRHVYLRNPGWGIRSTPIRQLQRGQIVPMRRRMAQPRPAAAGGKLNVPARFIP